jgi:hypothetical protein
MLRINNGLSNVHKRRTLRPLLAHTQATPVPMTLDSAFVRTGGALTGTATTGITGNTMGAILPGMVAVKGEGRTVTTSGALDTERPFGLFGQFVGGELDDLHGGDEVTVWSGPGSHWEILSPAFSDTGLSAAAAAEDGTDENEVYLEANAKAQLELRDQTAQTGRVLADCARLVERLSANAIVVQLLV